MTATDDALWQHVNNVLTWVDATNPRTDHEISMRVGAVQVEAGEAFDAYRGIHGQNPRKGVTHTTEDLADELCDVVVTALVALATVTGTADTARAALHQHLALRGPRLTAAILLQHERTHA